MGLFGSRRREWLRLVLQDNRLRVLTRRFFEQALHRTDKPTLRPTRCALSSASPIAYVQFASGSCAPHRLAIWVPLGPPSLIGLSVARAPCETSSRLFGDDSREPRATLIAKATGRRLSRRTTLDVSQMWAYGEISRLFGDKTPLAARSALCVGPLGSAMFDVSSPPIEWRNSCK